MAKSNTNARKGGNGSGNDWRDRIHRVELSFNQELEAQSWYDTNPYKWSAALEELLDDAWAVKITPPGRGDDWIISVTDKGSTRDTAGHTFVLYYPGLEGGMIVMFYFIGCVLPLESAKELGINKGKAFLRIE